RILNAGATLTYVSIDADIREELTRFERRMFKKRLRELGNYDFLTDTRLTSVQRQGRQLQIVLHDELTNTAQDMTVDQVLMECGTLPMDTLYDDLRAESNNDGVTDLPSIVHGQPQPAPDHGRFALYRIGDAVASRNVHAAMVDAFRLCMTM